MYNDNVMNTNSFDSNKIINEDINEILRGELSATEAYDQVLEKVKHDPEADRLKEFKLDHDTAVNFWKREARIKGKVPQHSSSAWGQVVEAFVGTSKLLGDKTALMALRKGEEVGLDNYKDMLKSDRLTKPQKLEIENSFIPRQKRHIDSINSLIKKVS